MRTCAAEADVTYWYESSHFITQILLSDIQDQAKALIMQKYDGLSALESAMISKMESEFPAGSVEWEKPAQSGVKHCRNTLNDTTGYCL